MPSKDRNVRVERPVKLDFQPWVSGLSAGLVLTFVGLSLASLNETRRVIQYLHGIIVRQVDWVYILTVNAFLVFVVLLAASRFGRIRLGGAEAKPEYSRMSWFAMLFSAGMGIGLLFYGVGEPMYHMQSAPRGDAPGSLEAARSAMALAYLHWGIHGWAVYAGMAVVLGYFYFNRGRPLTVSAAFQPLLGDRTDGPVGSVIDALAVVATLFGVSTSLGLGVSQINAGLAHLFGVVQSPTVQVVLIAIITGMATTSVVLGVDKGIRRLSEITMVLAALLILLVVVAGPSLAILQGFGLDLLRYVRELPSLSLSWDTYQNRSWHSDWTTFYWGWWIAWSPFVGMFIARISRGRTVRELIVGALLAPTLVTFLWLSVFGQAAIHEQLHGAGDMIAVVKDNFPVALYVLLGKYPLATASSVLAVIVVVTFFVTSSDSGSLVVDIITAGGKTDPPVAQRIFWAVMEGVVAATLLLGGGLKALQMGSVMTALPFAFVLITMAYCLVKAMREDTAVSTPSVTEELSSVEM